MKFDCPKKGLKRGRRYRKIKHVPAVSGDRRTRRVTLAQVARAAGVTRYIASDVLYGITKSKTPRNLMIIAKAKELGFISSTLAGEGVPTCPNCSSPCFKVKETRKAPDQWLRIRECKNCESRFMTSEVIVNERNYLQ